MLDLTSPATPYTLYIYVSELLHYWLLVLRSFWHLGGYSDLQISAKKERPVYTLYVEVREDCGPRFEIYLKTYFVALSVA